MNATVNASVSSGNDGISDPENAPVEAKAVKEGTSDMTTFRPALMESEILALSVPSAASKSEICTVRESEVPSGQMAFATAGAFCRLVRTTLPTASAAPARRGSSSGRKARPTVRAVRMSVRRTLVCLMGSISAMMGLMEREARVVANWVAVYHVLKRLLMAVVAR